MVLPHVRSQIPNFFKPRMQTGEQMRSRHVSRPPVFGREGLHTACCPTCTICHLCTSEADPPVCFLLSAAKQDCSLSGSVVPEVR